MLCMIDSVVSVNVEQWLFCFCNFLEPDVESQIHVGQRPAELAEGRWYFENGILGISRVCVSLVQVDCKDPLLCPRFHSCTVRNGIPSQYLRTRAYLF